MLPGGPVRQPYTRLDSILYPPVRDYEFGYSAEIFKQSMGLGTE